MRLPARASWGAGQNASQGARQAGCWLKRRSEPRSGRWLERRSSTTRKSSVFSTGRALCVLSREYSVLLSLKSAKNLCLGHRFFDEIRQNPLILLHFQAKVTDSLQKSGAPYGREQGERAIRAGRARLRWYARRTAYSAARKSSAC